MEEEMFACTTPWDDVMATAVAISPPHGTCLDWSQHSSGQNQEMGKRQCL